MFYIKAERISKGLTQKQLADKIGVHQTAVSQWEKGITQPSASTVSKIIKALGCKIEDIYREGGSSNA